MMKSTRLITSALFLVVLIALAFYLARLAPESEAVSSFVASYGYLGILLISLVSGFNLAVPVPAIAFMPLFVEAGLSYWVSIVVITAGVTLADSLAYLLARTGRLVVSEKWGKQVFAILETWREKYRIAPYVLLLLFASLAPLPNEVMLVPMGLMGYRYRKLLPVILLGNLAFGILYSQGLLGIYESL